MKFYLSSVTLFNTSREILEKFRNSQDFQKYLMSLSMRKTEE
jgi:hypothetical protein